jgi:hypothetical protein
VVAVPGAARAADSDESNRARARAKLDEGTALYDRGEYQPALQRFHEAYDTFPSPKIFFNLGLATRGLGRNAEALGWFRRFLDEATDAAPAPRAQAERLVSELQAQVASVEIACETDGAEVSVDGRPAGKTPLPKPLLVDPGPHQIVVEQPGGAGAPFTEKIAPRAGETVRVRAQLGAAAVTHAPPLATDSASAPTLLASASPAPPPSPPIYRRWWFWTAIGAVAAGGVAAFLLTRDQPMRQGSLGSDYAAKP